MYDSTLIPVTFAGGSVGPWAVVRARTLSGPALPRAERLEVHGGLVSPEGAAFHLRGVAGHARYVVAAEKAELDARSPPLGRPEATLGVLIPIKKSYPFTGSPRMSREERG